MHVSVIIPTYNRAHMLADTVNSVLRQTHTAYEIIVVDDGSTDDTPAVLSRFGDRIRVLHHPRNLGAGAARNHALDVAQGDAVAFLDSDDVWLDFKLDLQVRVLQALRGVAFLCTEFFIKTENGTLVPRGSRTWSAVAPRWEHIYARHVTASDLGLSGAGGRNFDVWLGPLYRSLLHEIFILPTTAIVRRAALKPGVRFAEHVPVFEDWEFFARLANANEAAFVDIETAVNTGHREPGRLTLCSSATKASHRLAMIERVWKADRAFEETHHAEIVDVQRDLLLELAKSALRDGDCQTARRALHNLSLLRVHSRAARRALLVGLASTPVGPRVLKWSSTALARARSLRTRRRDPRKKTG